VGVGKSERKRREPKGKNQVEINGEQMGKRKKVKEKGKRKRKEERKER